MQRIRTTPSLRPIPVLGLLILFAGCGEEPAGVLPPPDGAAPGQAASSAPDAGVALLAQGLALALADEGLREQLFVDLRDSPFPRHGLHLTSYLRGRDGRALADAAARALDLELKTFLELANGPPLELVVPRVLDRVTWTGTSEVRILGSARPPARLVDDEPVFTVFAVDGTVAEVDSYAGPKEPLLALFPISGSEAYGQDPEATRLAAPRGKGNTITTRKSELEEMGTLAVDPIICPELIDPNCEPVDPPEPTPSPTYGINLGFSYDACRQPGDVVPDADYDFFDDTCEWKLARAFEPVLGISWNDRYAGREPYHAVRPFGTNRARIFYLLAYYEDRDHPGDSEFIELEVLYNTSTRRWQLTQGLYSAHFHTLLDRTRYYSASSLQYWDVARGRPLAYVATGKHANYNSRSNCDWPDSCVSFGSSQTQVVGVDSSYNIGADWCSIEVLGLCFGVRLHNCVRSRASNLPATECLWTGYDFAGWNDASGVKSYGDILWFFGWKGPS